MGKTIKVQTEKPWKRKDDMDPLVLTKSKERDPFEKQNDNKRFQDFQKGGSEAVKRNKPLAQLTT
ncbi:MAG: hypothetical protein ABIF85_06670 [Nanoarchaeota archaeon]|nr:hypothetical protein [Nanoarchaeota archaeon]MBU4451332.1 hypothetical protein [Nanoarchaeota archaeon]MCG2723293.1 hypothetical protein [archaeon]